MQEKKVSKPRIKALILRHSNPANHPVNTYHEELEFITQDARRSNLLCSLAINQARKGSNVLILSALVEKHILPLTEHLKKNYESGKVFSVTRITPVEVREALRQAGWIEGGVRELEPGFHGVVAHPVGEERLRLVEVFCDDVFSVTRITPVEVREALRQFAERETGIIIVASYGTFQLGISIKNLQTIILGTNSKSRIRILQSIGRGLRLDGKTNELLVVDIVDLIDGNNKKNYSFEHFRERLSIYAQEAFPVTIKELRL